MTYSPAMPAEAGERSSLSPAGRFSNQALWDWLGAGALATLFVCYYVGTQSLILGSREGGWTFDYVAVFSARMVIVALAAAAVSAALVFGLRAADAGTRRDGLVVLAWIVGGLVVQVLIRSLTPFSFERIFSSAGANSFFEVTRHVRAATVLRDFDRVRTTWPLHAQSNMPGKLMLVYALRILSREPAVLAWLTVAVSNAGALPMYSFVRELFGDKRVALYSAALYLIVPAKLAFFPLLNTVTPVIVLACAALLLEWLRTGRAVYAAVLGLTLFVLVFFEPLPLVMGLLFAMLVLRAVLLEQIAWRRALWQTIIGLAAWFAAYLCMRLLTGFDLVAAFREIGKDAIRFNAEAHRPYSTWVLADPGEFLFGVGVCQVVVFLAALADGFRRDAPLRESLTQPIVVLCAGLAAVLLAIDVIGVNRGEVIRLWIFLACFFQVPAAYLCARVGNRAALMLVMAATILQATLGTAMIGFVVPN